LGDINDFLTDLPVGRQIDCVFGGPPCQGFSVAGKMDAKDLRSQLVFSFMEVVKRTRPRVFVLENVKALATLAKFSAVREELLRRAERVGYTAQILVLNAKDFGVPQSRERLFMIGFRDTLRIRFHAGYLDRYRADAPPLRAVFKRIGRPGSEGNPSTCLAKITLAERPVMRKSPYAGMLFNGLGRPVNPDSVSCTLPASMGGNKTPIVDDKHMYGAGSAWVEEYHARLMAGGKPLGMYDAPVQLRRLTITEARAIQTFPEDYVFCGPKGAIYTQIGNAVPCGLARAVAGAVADALDRRPVSRPASDRQLSLM
jgi:DNA (cytosine-5)-methyltransferase 1